MKKHFLFLLLATFLLSCSKENNTPELEVNKDPMPQFSMSAAKFKSSSRFLKREVSYTKQKPLLKDAKLFTYDPTNRVTEIKIGTIDSSISNPVFSLKQTLTFNYTTPDALLPASVSSVKTVFPNLVTTFYYKYNSGGRKLMDSVRLKNAAGDPADGVMQYTYTQDQVFVTPVLNGFPIENNAFDTLSLLSGGNIEKLVSKMIRPTGNQVSTYTFTYDKGFSPYNQLNIANALYFEHPSLGLGYNVPRETHYMGVTTNNLSSWTTGNYTVQFKYLYNEDKFPVKKEMFLPGETDAAQTTYFEY